MLLLCLMISCPAEGFWWDKRKLCHCSVLTGAHINTCICICTFVQISFYEKCLIYNIIQYTCGCLTNSSFINVSACALACLLAGAKSEPTCQLPSKLAWYMLPEEHMALRNSFVEQIRAKEAFFERKKFGASGTSLHLFDFAHVRHQCFQSFVMQCTSFHMFRYIFVAASSCYRRMKWVLPRPWSGLTMLGSLAKRQRFDSMYLYYSDSHLKVKPSAPSSGSQTMSIRPRSKCISDLLEHGQPLSQQLSHTKPCHLSCHSCSFEKVAGTLHSSASWSGWTTVQGELGRTPREDLGWPLAPQ